MKVPALDHLRAERVVLFPRAVHPVDGRGLREPGHLLDPPEQVVVLAQRDRRVTAIPRGTGLLRGGRAVIVESSHAEFLPFTRTVSTRSSFIAPGLPEGITAVILPMVSMTSVDGNVQISAKRWCSTETRFPLRVAF